MLVASLLVYRGGLQSVETDLRNAVVLNANGIAREMDAVLNETEAALAGLARLSALREYVTSPDAKTNRPDDPHAKVRSDDPKVESAGSAIPRDVEESIRAFMIGKANRYASIYCLSTSGKTLFWARSVTRPAPNDKNGTTIEFHKENFIPASVDPRVWTTRDQTPLRSPLSKEANGAVLRYTVPVFVGTNADEPASRGALIVELDGDTLLNDATFGRVDGGRDATGSSGFSASQREIVILDHERRILYHTNEALRYQSVDAVIPTFSEISRAMTTGEAGWNFYDASNTRWLVAYRPVTSLGVFVGVAGNYSAATERLSRRDWVIVVLFSLFGLMTMIVSAFLLRNTARSIERVTEGAVAIAAGRLEQRIEVRSNDETRLLAESFNIMTDRLREQIARETESRQFESFMRLSAMLTHDLKNAIAGLSLLVGNMERQFHREEFRADAMRSLTQATDKLRRLVSKLSEPVESLSSEHQLPRRVDLIPMIRKALDITVEPVRDSFQIEIHLPDSLVATVEADRIEKVFENLIINAIEAMGARSGKLTIEAGSMSQGEVFFSVSDTGPGMSDEFQRVKLFRPFSTTKKSGIGLGLYTCREVVHAHGGRVEVESKRGFGATFRVVLPSEPKIVEKA